MKPEYTKNDIIKYRLNKAHKNLYDAKLIAGQHLLDPAMNRIYYACFHATSALLLNEDFNPKSHKGVRKMLGLHFIEKGRISKEWGRFYNDTFEYRHKSDYEDFFVLNVETISEFLSKADDFIQIIQKLIEN